MAVANVDLADVVPRCAIEGDDAVGVSAPGLQQLIERTPAVPPIGIEVDALAQFRTVDAARVPVVERLLVMREDEFDSENDLASCFGQGLNQFGSEFL